MIRSPEVAAFRHRMRGSPVVPAMILAWLIMGALLMLYHGATAHAAPHKAVHRGFESLDGGFEGATVERDRVTGCEYLVQDSQEPSYITPRLGHDGRPLCR